MFYNSNSTSVPINTIKGCEDIFTTCEHARFFRLSIIRPFTFRPSVGRFAVPRATSQTERFMIYDAAIYNSNTVKHQNTIMVVEGLLITRDVKPNRQR